MQILQFCTLCKKRCLGDALETPKWNPRASNRRLNLLQVDPESGGGEGRRGRVEKGRGEEGGKEGGGEVGKKGKEERRIMNRAEVDYESGGGEKEEAERGRRWGEGRKGEEEG